MNDSRDKQSGETGATARKLGAAGAGSARNARCLRSARRLYGRSRRGPGRPPASILLEYWRIVNRRKWLIAGMAAAFLVFGAVRTLMTTPLYTATVRLQIDRNVAKVVEGGNVTPLEGADSRFLRTQYELLKSRAMAERVASALKLGEDADLFKPTGFSMSGRCARPVAIGSGRRHASEQGRTRARRGRHRAGSPHGTARGRLSAGRCQSIPIPSLAGAKYRHGLCRAFIAPISTSASKPMPMPRPFSRTSSSN